MDMNHVSPAACACAAAGAASGRQVGTAPGRTKCVRKYVRYRVMASVSKSEPWLGVVK